MNKELLRLHGEIHQWMYDKYSLSFIFTIKNGGSEIEIMGANSSKNLNWKKYKLDLKNDMPKKPDLLYIECVKL